jgi:phosphate transport system protein
MGKALDKEIESLKGMINEMTVTARSMVKDVMEGLVRRDKSLYSKVNDMEEAVNKFEMLTDDLSWKIIALRQPMGADLRFVLAARKINSVLERTADEAINISKKVDYLITVPELKPLIDLPRMTEMAIDALSSAIETVYNADMDAARAICINDSVIDNLRDQIHRELLTYMQESPDNIQRALNLMMIAKSLERIGDMATDIAEDAIYYHQGKDIRHHAESDEEFKKNYKKKEKK